MTSNSLDDYSWKVIGNRDVLIDKYEVDRKHMGEGAIGSIEYTNGVIVDLAEAYFGIQPWNDMFEEDFYDQLLLSAVTRPSSVIILNQTERKQYREEIRNLK